MEPISTPQDATTTSNRTVGPSGRNFFRERPNVDASDGSVSAMAAIAPLNIGSHSFIGFGPN